MTSEGRKVRCRKCGYEWIYKGRRYYATCPKCQSVVRTEVTEGKKVRCDYCGYEWIRYAPMGSRAVCPRCGRWVRPGIKTKRLKCGRCGHEWDYSGKAKEYTSCPVCHSGVRVGERKRPATSKRLRCHKCGYEWDYRGKGRRYVTCPRCYSSVKTVKEEVKEVLEPRVEIKKEGEVDVIEVDLPNVLKCKHCGYEWVYRGAGRRYTPCPRCHRPVKVPSIRDVLPGVVFEDEHRPFP